MKLRTVLASSLAAVTVSAGLFMAAPAAQADPVTPTQEQVRKSLIKTSNFIYKAMLNDSLNPKSRTWNKVGTIKSSAGSHTAVSSMMGWWKSGKRDMFCVHIKYSDPSVPGPSGAKWMSVSWDSKNDPWGPRLSMEGCL